KRSTNLICVVSLKPKCTSFKARRWILSAPHCHFAAVFRVAPASRVLVSASRRNNLYRKNPRRRDAFAITRDARAPRKLRRASSSDLLAHFASLRSRLLSRGGKL